MFLYLISFVEHQRDQRQETVPILSPTLLVYTRMTYRLTVHIVAVKIYVIQLDVEHQVLMKTNN